MQLEPDPDFHDRLLSLVNYHNYTKITVEQVKSRIDNDFDINIDDLHGNTSLIYACWKNEPNLEIIKLIVEKGANLNHTNIWGQDALISACNRTKVDLEVIEYLIESGANKVHSDNDGKSALDYAAIRGHEDIVGYLTDTDFMVRPR